MVTQWQPQGRLAYTWNVYNPGDATSPYPESYLILTLAAAVEGTLPTLDHLPVLEKFVKLNAMAGIPSSTWSMPRSAARPSTTAPQSSKVLPRRRIGG